jgi:DnaJ-class molecular chaperone
MSKHMPKVLEDTAIDAKSRFDVCRTCRGTGEIIDGKKDTYVKCWKCSGKGKIRKPGDTDARKLVFESAGLTNKSRPAVNVNVGAGAGAVPPVESDMQGIDRILDIQPVKQEKPS